jgi:hypothetical protein
MDYEQMEKVAPVTQSFFVQKSNRSNPQLKNSQSFLGKMAPRRMHFYSLALPKLCLRTEARHDPNQLPPQPEQPEYLAAWVVGLT